MRNNPVFIILLSFIFVSPVFSQTEKGSLLLGGGFGFGQSETENASITSASISPNIGVFIADGFALGIRPFAAVARVNGVNNPSLGITPFVRYYINTGDKIKPFLAANLGYTASTVVNPFNQERDWVGGFSAGGGPGLAIFLNRNVALELRTSYQYAQFGDNAHTSNFGLSGGFQIHLPTGGE